MSVIKYCKVVQNAVVSKNGVRLSYRKFMQNCVIVKAAVRLQDTCAKIKLLARML